MKAEKIIDKLIEQLKDKGYPQNSFFIGYEIIDAQNRNNRFDLAICDTSTKEPLVLFQIREERKYAELTQEQIAGYNGRTVFFKNLFGEKKIPLYYVFPGEDTQLVDIREFTKISGEVRGIPVDGNSGSDQNNRSIALYQELVNSSHFEDISNISKGRIEFEEQLTRWGKFLSITFFIVWIITKVDDFLVLRQFFYSKNFDKLVLKLDYTDLGLFVLITFLIFIPYIEKFSFNGISFELKKKQIKDKNISKETL